MNNREDLSFDKSFKGEIHICNSEAQSTNAFS